MVVEFFYRTEPHSSKAKPHCMKKIIEAETKIHTALIASLSV
jgi:hypothetical protein